MHKEGNFMGNLPTEEQLQYLANYWTDQEVRPKTLMVGLLEFDGTSYSKKTTGNAALKITETGGYTYIGSAPIGSTQASAVWQCKRLYDDGSGNTTLTWADGNSNFDNVATDLTSLTYS